MTQGPQRYVLVLLAAMIGAGAAVAQPRPNFPVRMEDVPPSARETRREISLAPAPNSTAKGKLVEVGGPAESYRVKSGDTLDKIARILGTDIEQLARDNDLAPPYRIRPGDTLTGPRGLTKVYVVASGDTLYGISRRFSTTPQALAEANGIAVGAVLRAGQELRLPGQTSAPPQPRMLPPPEEPAPPPPPRPVVATPTPTPSPPRPPASAPSQPIQLPVVPPTLATIPPRPAPEPAMPTAPSLTPVRPYAPLPAGPPVAAPAGDAQVAQMGAGRFIWPIRGELISGFGPKTVGQRNDGINLRARPGDAVFAAAGGDVVYAGDQVPGFGNLVLIRHADGWVTAYGHMARVDVKMTQKVTQGQQIGTIGASGGAPEPQLHFEIRYAVSALDRARPVDPMLVLPK
jgi:murein DD-endopeptidase MepM/ murein hydrolase activator NlpD